VRLKKGGKRFEVKLYVLCSVVIPSHKELDCVLQEQSTGVENGGVCLQKPQHRSFLITVDRETNLDDVLQINNVFVNVSKGEVAKSGDLQKAFGKIGISDIVKEVRRLVHFVVRLLIDLPLDPQERGSPSGRERKGP